MGPKEGLDEFKGERGGGFEELPFAAKWGQQAPALLHGCAFDGASRKEPAQGHPLLVKAKTFSVHTSTQLKPCGSQGQLEVLWATNGPLLESTWIRHPKRAFLRAQRPFP